MARRADLILANRSYLDHDSPRGNEGPDSPASGGLLAAVRPAIAPWDGTGTTWIGAGRGAFDGEFADTAGYELLPTPSGPLRHRRLTFGPETWDSHYGAVANSFLWPLLHLVRRPLAAATGYYPEVATPSNADWEAYVRVNRRFAAAAIEEGREKTCWVHDYQLGLVPAALRELGHEGRVGFFLHTPFPDTTVVAAALDPAGLERFKAWVCGLLGADLLGLQTPADVSRFAAAVEHFALGRFEGGILHHVGGRTAVAGYPVGVDCDEVGGVPASAAVPAEMSSLVAQESPLVVGLERSDFTKGIPERLRAVAAALGTGVPLVYGGIAAPTREGIAAYDRLAAEIDRAAFATRAAAAQMGLPFLHVHRAIPWPEVVALQREADVIFTSSLADGMNLVPLQAAIAQAGQPAAQRAMLIAGSDAGVAQVYADFADEGLTAVDPLDPSAMAGVAARAARGELPRVSDRLIAAIRARDSRAWAASFLGDLEDAGC